MTQSKNVLKDAHPSVQNSRFMKAVRREPTDATPIWLMRQAGRYMPEYRALREKHSFLDMVKTPEIATEITLQPINAFDLDAAIIFADILPPLEGMGLHLTFEKGEGPVLHNPIRAPADVDALRTPDAHEALGFTLDTIRLVRRELDARSLPLIGFSGAPFTLAAYAIEGGGSRDYQRAKTFMMNQPQAWHRLMEKLSTVISDYLVAQAQAGANVLQLFDSWVGALSPADYREFVLPYSQRVIKIAKQSGVPIIHFGTNTSGMLEFIRDAGGDVIGVDWRIDLASAWARLGDEVAIQGNLDPITLLGEWDTLQSHAQLVLDQAAGRSGHIFNLGHGIVKETPPDNVKRLVDFVHEYTHKWPHFCG
jgi:uroporphyrinogen decarboxylase